MNKIYIVDFLNIFSDFREIKYKKNKIDFHNVKYENVLNDTYDFFDMFFNKYTKITNINIKHSNFIFVMKKIQNFETIIKNALKKYPEFNFRFVVIENKFNNETLDKNKDDFLCQYFFYYLKKRHDCILISNDKYRDLPNYINKFPSLIKIKVYKLMSNDLVLTTNTIDIAPDIKNQIDNILSRCSIPKYKLHHIL